MQLGINPAVSFKSDYYSFFKFGTNLWLTSIKTDDSPAKNKELLLRVKDYHGEIKGDFPMTYDGKYYTYKFPYILCLSGYKILNKDNDEGAKELNEFELSKKINAYDRMSTGRPMEKVVAKGVAKGLVVTDLNNIPQNIPVIVAIDKLETDRIAYDMISSLPENVYGIIINNAKINDLTHTANITGQYFDVVSVVYDDKKYNDFKKLSGKNIEISNEKGQIEYFVTEQLPDLSETRRQTPNIPVLDEETRLLDFSELTRKNSGEKAYRLGLMQRLLKEGYLSDIEIPPGFVIPLGYINKIYEYINAEEDEFEREKRIVYHPLNTELERVCHQYGIKENRMITRSAFNAEDLPDYPTAGIYDSSSGGYYRYLISDIHDVVTSKDGKAAINSRKRYGLEDAIIQPTIIVQQLIKPDYKFTLYTDSDDRKLKIEMFTKKVNGGDKNPAEISYDRKTGEIKLETLPYIFGDYVIKDTGEIVEQHLKEDEIQKDWAVLLAPVGVAIKNALKLEKYFGRPQDIEGGILNGKVFFWQTRDIIKRVVKR